MDITLQSGISSIVDMNIDSKGKVSEKANIINRKQFEYLQNYIEKIIKQISEEIYDGNISIYPYYKKQGTNTPCEYCEYKSICNFNKITKNDYRFISKYSKENIFEKIKKE